MTKKELLIILGVSIVVLGILGFYFLKFQTPTQQLPEQSEVGEESTEENQTQPEEALSDTSKLLSWQKEDGIRVPNAISSSTIFKDDAYWMYYTGSEGIHLTRSSDGLNFKDYGPVVKSVHSGPDALFITNPTVFQTKDDGYRMIYEGSKDNQAVRKLYSAVSDDGLEWTKESGVRLEDTIFEERKNYLHIFTSVPDVIRLEDDCLRMYYTAIDESRMAISCDEGLTWKKEGKIMFDVYPEVAQDPDIIQFEDGTYKLFFSTQDFERTKGWIVSASSEDGINFKVEGKIIEPSIGITHVMDTDAIRLPDGRYRIYYSEGNLPYPESNILSAVSQD